MPKDPNKPKGRCSAYAYYVSRLREELRKQNPGGYPGFAEFSKICSEGWKLLSVEQKKPFNTLADQDKARYEEEMKHYTPPSKHGDGFQVQAKGQKRKVGEGKVKDKNAPKRAESAYALFSKQYRDEVRQSTKNLSSSDVTKELKQMWGRATNEFKLKFEARAAQEKDRFRMEKEAYDRRNTAEEQRSAGGKMARTTQGHAQPQIFDYDDDQDEDEDANGEESGGDYDE